jgi:hypothetical protein
MHLEFIIDNLYLGLHKSFVKFALSIDEIWHESVINAYNYTSSQEYIGMFCSSFFFKQ